MAEMAKEWKHREDLFYRLNIVTVTIISFTCGLKREFGKP
jgi:transcriptional regulator with PAS, ATPase and Fis domain